MSDSEFREGDERALTRVERLDAGGGPRTPTPQNVQVQFVGGGRMARDLVAQATSMVVADAANYMRALSQVSVSGIAVCTEMMIRNKDPEYATMMAQIQQSLSDAATTFQKLGVGAASVLQAFPGADPPAATSTEEA